MDALQTSPQIGETVLLANVVRQRVNNVLCKIVQDGCDDTPQLAARDSGYFLVNRYIAADVQRRRLIALLQKFEFRIEKHVLRFMTIEIDSAEEHHFPPRTELASLQITAMKPLRVDKTAAVRQDYVENTPSCAGLDHTASVNARVDGRLLTDSQ